MKIVEQILRENGLSDPVVQRQQRPIEIGGISANIGGDYRYTDYLTVHYNPVDDTVSVSVSTTGPVGGMDYDSGGKVNSSLDFHQKAPATPKELMKLLRIPLSDPQFNFKRYGKPTKNFRWTGRDKLGISYDGEIKGLSMNVVTKVLNNIKNDMSPKKNDVDTEWEFPDDIEAAEKAAMFKTAVAAEGGI